MNFTKKGYYSLFYIQQVYLIGRFHPIIEKKSNKKNKYSKLSAKTPKNYHFNATHLKGRRTTISRRVDTGVHFDLERDYGHARGLKRGRPFLQKIKKAKNRVFRSRSLNSFQSIYEFIGTNCRIHSNQSLNSLESICLFFSFFVFFADFLSNVNFHVSQKWAKNCHFDIP